MINDQALIAELPRIRRYARALVGDQARADDLVQDTVERALRKQVHWQGGSLRAWLLTLMHNVFVNQIRKNDPMRASIRRRASSSSPKATSAAAAITLSHVRVPTDPLASTRSKT